MSRDPQEFEQPELIQQFKDACAVAGLIVMITCVSRSEDEQRALYAQGRESLDVVDALRKLVHWLPITEAENKVCTWTMKSKHILDPITKKCKAFDFAVVKDGKIIWSVKADVNQTGIPDYNECGIIGETLGLKWGGRFKSPDRPHMELM